MSEGAPPTSPVFVGAGPFFILFFFWGGEEVVRVNWWSPTMR